MQEPVSTIGAAGSLSLTGRRSSFPPPELLEEAVLWEMDFVRGRYETCDNESISVTVVPDLIQVPGGFTDSQKVIIPGDHETGASGS